MHCGKVLFVGLLLLSLCCVGLKTSKIETNVEELWVEGKNNCCIVSFVIRNKRYPSKKNTPVQKNMQIQSLVRTLTEPQAAILVYDPERLKFNQGGVWSIYFWNTAEKRN